MCYNHFIFAIEKEEFELQKQPFTIIELIGLIKLFKTPKKKKKASLTTVYHNQELFSKINSTIFKSTSLVSQLNNYHKFAFNYINKK